MRIFQLTLLPCFVLLLPVAAGAADRQDFEDPPTLLASEVLPQDLLEGEYHRVRDRVESDGYLNRYVVDTDFGEFEVTSTAKLRERVREFAALAELQRVSKTGVFAEAALDAGLSPARSIVTFAKDPVGTVTGVPAGIGRLFVRVSRGVGSVTQGGAADGEDDVEYCADRYPDEAEREACVERRERVARERSLWERYFGTTDAERRWHQELGTDPYTTNDVLFSAVKSVSWADRLGRFGVRFVGIPSIPGVGYISTATDLVWSEDPYELRNHNETLLVEMGIDEETVSEVLGNPWLSPTMQTLLISALLSLEDVPGRHYALLAAANTTTEAQARFVVQSVVALTWFNASDSAVLEFLENPYFPVVRVESGNIMTMLPVDYLSWTEGIASAAETSVDRGRQYPEAQRELWLLGDISPRARREITARGWIVRPGVFELMETVYEAKHEAGAGEK